MEPLKLVAGKKIYIASDFHLGAPNDASSLVREKNIVQWLNTIQADAQAVFLLGDVFDFWYEYKKVVPKGFIRLQGKLAELADSGIAIYLFGGNHDMWMFDYFTEQFNAKIFYKPISVTLGNHRFYIAHGDGLGKGDYGYKILQKIFRSPISHFLFTCIPTRFAIGFAQRWSKSSRLMNGEEKFFGADKERLLQYCKTIEEKHHHDYYLFGHRHLALQLPVNEQSLYINTGEWVHHPAYAVYDGQALSLIKL